MTWTLNLIARPEYAGATKAPRKPVAYFEALPSHAKPGIPMHFNGAITAANHNPGLRYAWRFGDGQRGRGTRVTHTYRHDGWYLARLAVKSRDGRTSGYEQMVRIGHPTGARPKSHGCGHVSAVAVHRMTRHLVAGTGGGRPATPAGDTPLATTAGGAGGPGSALPASAGIALLAAFGVRTRRSRSRRRPRLA
jgi:hypothetical protein